eukprot:scaffold17359_cov142-Isochrysis_galbana.AAC.1
MHHTAQALGYAQIAQHKVIQWLPPAARAVSGRLSRAGQHHSGDARHRLHPHQHARRAARRLVVPPGAAPRAVVEPDQIAAREPARRLGQARAKVAVQHEIVLHDQQPPGAARATGSPLVHVQPQRERPQKREEKSNVVTPFSPGPVIVQGAHQGAVAG